MRFRLFFLAFSAICLSSIANAKPKIFMNEELKVDPFGDGYLPVSSCAASDCTEEVRLKIADAFCRSHDYGEADDFQVAIDFSSGVKAFSVYRCEPAVSKRLKLATCVWQKINYPVYGPSDPIFRSITCINPLSQDQGVQVQVQEEL